MKQTLSRSNDTRFIHHGLPLVAVPPHLIAFVLRPRLSVNIPWNPQIWAPGDGDDIGLLPVHGAKRVVPSRPEQAHRDNGHIGGLVPQRWRLV